MSDDVDFLDEGAQAKGRETQLNKDLEFAQTHLFFDTDPRAAALLKFWKETVVARRVPIGSTLDAYAAAEAVRAFVAVIEQQIAFAKKGTPV